MNQEHQSLVEILSLLVKLKTIKRRIDAREATDEERAFYRGNKEAAWATAEALLEEHEVVNLTPSGYEALTMHGVLEKPRRERARRR